jgi:hypothetical protein
MLQGQLLMRGLIKLPPPFRQREGEVFEIVDLAVEQGRSAALACAAAADDGMPFPTQEEIDSGCALVERCGFRR